MIGARDHMGGKRGLIGGKRGSFTVLQNIVQGVLQGCGSSQVLALF